jgi:phosphatidylinositol kinase/protein kinase (PI-3  family)
MLQNASVVNTNAEFLSPVSHDLILKEQRCQAYDEICSKVVPNDLLSRFVYSKLQSYEAYWHVRKQFTIQIGIIGYLSYLLSMGKQDPHKICINMSSGLVQYADLKPNYKSSLDNENNVTTTLGNDESIPFRLTPNISHFISPPGIKGVLTSSMMALSNALKENESFFEDYLHLFLSDDIQAFEKKQDKLKNTEVSGYDTAAVGSDDASSNTSDSTGSGSEGGAVDLKFKKRVAKNVKLVLSRINLTTPVNMPPKYDRSTCMTSGRPINEGTRSNNNIRVLIDCAMDQKQLAQMPPNWQSWL